MRISFLRGDLKWELFEVRALIELYGHHFGEVEKPDLKVALGFKHRNALSITRPPSIYEQVAAMLGAKPPVLKVADMRGLDYGYRVHGEAFLEYRAAGFISHITPDTIRDYANELRSLPDIYPGVKYITRTQAYLEDAAIYAGVSTIHEELLFATMTGANSEHYLWFIRKWCDDNGYRFAAKHWWSAYAKRL